MTRAILLGIAAAAGLSAQPAPSITITLTGQSMIRSDLRVTAPAAIPAVRALLHGDVVFTNFEGAVAESGESVREGRGFLAPPGALDALAAVGVNLLSLSNNHAFDLKAGGIEHTIREADARHLVHAGTGRTLSEASAPAYLRTTAGTVALVSSASGLIASGAAAGSGHPGVNELRVAAGGVPNEATTDLAAEAANTPNAEDAQRILRSIRDAHAHADVVVVYQHNHVFGSRSFSTIFTEGLPERLAPNAWLQAWTHAEIDAGADIVVMHGAPLLHGIEIYRGRPIFYDLGNFIYNVPPTLTYIDEPMAWESAVATVRVQGHSVTSISLQPIVLNPIGAGQPDVHDPYADNEFLHTRGLPSAATGARAGYILRRIAEASKKFGTTVSVSGETAAIALKPAR